MDDARLNEDGTWEISYHTNQGSVQGVERADILVVADGVNSTLLNLLVPDPAHPKYPGLIALRGRVPEHSQRFTQAKDILSGKLM